MRRSRGVMLSIALLPTVSWVGLSLAAATAALSPPSLSQDSPAPYPEEARSARAEGEVQLDVLVGADGSVQEVKLAQGVHPALDAAALAAAKELRFTPALMDGEAVAVWIHFTYRFV